MESMPLWACIAVGFGIAMLFTYRKPKPPSTP